MAAETTHDQAVAHKQSAAAVAAKQWRHFVEPNAQAAADFLNLAPAQGAGEACIASRADGRVDVYYYL
jgi:hypothetical protein